jgi:hypothetical protein
MTTKARLLAAYAHKPVTRLAQFDCFAAQRCDDVIHDCGGFGGTMSSTDEYRGLLSLSVGLGAAGLAGVMYGAVIARYIRGQGTEYVPVREDWIFNMIVPTLTYAALLVMAFLIWERPRQTLYCVAALALVLLSVGIRNAWDIAVWMTLAKPRDPSEKN